jgi:hypothetical protein
MRITLVCWHCDALLSVTLDRPPRFGFELADAANKAGWYGAIDLNRNRALVFCCKEHSEAEKTKKGVFRACPIGVKANT